MTIERRAGDGSWERVASRQQDRLSARCSPTSVEFETDAKGFYLRTVYNIGGGSYRARWLLPDGRSRTSNSPPGSGVLLRQAVNLLGAGREH